MFNDAGGPTAAAAAVKRVLGEAALAAWMRIGEIKAETIETAAFTRDSFELALHEARRLTRVSDPSVWFPQLQNSAVVREWS